MTASKKVLLAVVILSAGYGVARMLGGPSIPLLPQVAEVAEVPQAGVAASNGNFAAPTVGPYAIGSARLVPDVRDVSVPQFDASESSPQSSMTRDETGFPPAAETTAPVAVVNSPRRDAPGPRAKLRNEAPRPLAVEPLSPEVSVAEQAVSIRNRQSSLVPVQFAREDTVSASAESMSREATPSSLLNAAHFAPVPMQPAIDAEAPRAHIIVDGDSLAKLAGRYLDDPHRAAEIYELNRHVLSDPDLLPIGVELQIPSSAAAANNAVPSPQSFMPRAVAIHTTAGSGLVPVRPIPSASGLMPRAYLAAPRTAP